MSGTSPTPPPTRPPLRCDRCGDLLGVYEPLVALEGDTARGTSLAAERSSGAGGTYIHRACHLRDGGTLPAEGPGAAA